MTTSIKEKERRTFVREAIKNNFNFVSPNAIKLKLRYNNVFLKEKFTNEEKTNITERMKIHLAELSKETKIFEYKVSLFLSDYSSIIHTDRIYVYDYKQSRFLGNFHFFKKETRILMSTTTGRILSDKKADFLNDLNKNPIESYLRIFILGGKNKKLKIPLKNDFISQNLKKIKKTFLKLKKEKVYNDFIKKYNIHYNFSFNISHKKNIVEVHVMSENKQSYIRKMLSLMSKKNILETLPETTDIESKIIHSLIENEYLNYDAYLIYLEDNALTLIDLIEHNDILGY